MTSRKRVLGVSTGIDDVGHLQLELTISLLVMWILVYFCVWKGIKTSGKVVYFTGNSQINYLFSQGLVFIRVNL